MNNLYKGQKTGGKPGGNGRKKGEKCNEIPMLPNPSSPIFSEPTDLPFISYYKT